MQGAADTITAWIPLTDLSPEMGGLQIAAGTHRKGVFDFVPALGAGGTEITDPLHGAWVGGTFEQGDVLFFHSMTVHRGAPATGTRLRLSVDYAVSADGGSHRAGQPQDRMTPTSPGSRFTRAGRRGSTSTSGATGTSTLAEFDTQYNEKRDSMAFELAAKGDAEARATLLRIVARDPDPAKKLRAEEALAALDADTA